MKILMVCLGNICRSPIAEGIMQDLINRHQLDWQVDSAGTNGYHTGEAPHRFSQKVCLHAGIDISAQRSRRFTRQDFADYDYILVMAQDVYEDVCRLSSQTEDLQKVHYFTEPLAPGMRASVTDPWYGTEAGYQPVFDQIASGCNAWLDFWRQKIPIINSC